MWIFSPAIKFIKTQRHYTAKEMGLMLAQQAGLSFEPHQGGGRSGRQARTEQNIYITIEGNNKFDVLIMVLWRKNVTVAYCQKYPWIGLIFAIAGAYIGDLYFISPISYLFVLLGFCLGGIVNSVIGGKNGAGGEKWSAITGQSEPKINDIVVAAADAIQRCLQEESH
jgi:hypothetical protein